MLWSMARILRLVLLIPCLDLVLKQSDLLKPSTYEDRINALYPITEFETPLTPG